MHGLSGSILQKGPCIRVMCCDVRKGGTLLHGNGIERTCTLVVCHHHLQSSRVPGYPETLVQVADAAFVAAKRND